ncbi:hypothetical protein [Neobacillus ginsengisoli]|uniref:Uncharacterized protein n=1 Tax=Neobacillus ginsengisoli TaxID=904295 RepID=A0ABT9XV25_9BACI|nr:hypothetical protein [Neobacillus ginsengisoli]MDQ0199110.1 hypothetical protein [Neobacillus ginsengisoli]
MEQQKDNEVIVQLKQALSHLEQAIRLTIQSLKENQESKNNLGYVWEEFLGTFFGKIKTIGKENKINLLNLVSFERLKKFQ